MPINSFTVTYKLFQIQLSEKQFMITMMNNLPLQSIQLCWNRKYNIGIQIYTICGNNKLKYRSVTFFIVFSASATVSTATHTGIRPKLCFYSRSETYIFCTFITSPGHCACSCIAAQLVFRVCNFASHVYKHTRKHLKLRRSWRWCRFIFADEFSANKDKTWSKSTNHPYQLLITFFFSLLFPPSLLENFATTHLFWTSSEIFFESCEEF